MANALSTTASLNCSFYSIKRHDTNDNNNNSSENSFSASQHGTNHGSGLDCSPHLLDLISRSNNSSDFSLSSHTSMFCNTVKMLLRLVYAKPQLCLALECSSDLCPQAVHGNSGVVSIFAFYGRVWSHARQKSGMEGCVSAIC